MKSESMICIFSTISLLVQMCPLNGTMAQQMKATQQSVSSVCLNKAIICPKQTVDLELSVQVHVDSVLGGKYW